MQAARIVDVRIDLVLSVVRSSDVRSAVAAVVALLVDHELGFAGIERGGEAVVVCHVEGAGDIGAVGVS